MQNGQDKMEISKGIPRSKTGSWWRSNWIRVKKLHRIYNIDNSQGDPDGLGDEEHRAGELQRPDHLYVYVQRHQVEK